MFDDPVRMSKFIRSWYENANNCRVVVITKIIQGDRKVTQPILKYLLMIAIQYNSTGLINTQYHCDYTRAHTGHIML
jgi:hypothetical protein